MGRSVLMESFSMLGMLLSGFVREFAEDLRWRMGPVSGDRYESSTSSWERSAISEALEVSGSACMTEIQGMFSSAAYDSKVQSVRAQRRRRWRERRVSRLG